MAVLETMKRRLGGSARRCPGLVSSASQPGSGSPTCRTVRLRTPTMGGKIFQMSGAADDRFLPLCPLDHAEDNQRYLDIDDSQRTFDQFVEKAKNSPEFHATGQLVVVTGERGSGKTSLINRCAHWLNDRPQVAFDIVIVNLVDQCWVDTEVAAERARRTFGLILAKLSQYLSQDDISAIRETLAIDIHQAFYQLGAVLAVGRAGSTGSPRPIVAVVLLPCYPTAKEILLYSAAIGPGMIFFAEIWDLDQIDECAGKLTEFRSPRMFIQHLGMGKLKVGDAQLLIDQIRKDEGISPDMPQTMLDEIFKESLEDSGWTVLELRKLLQAVLRYAAAEAASFVTDVHVGRYYKEYYLERRRLSIFRMDPR